MHTVTSLSRAKGGLSPRATTWVPWRASCLVKVPGAGSQALQSQCTEQQEAGCPGSLDRDLCQQVTLVKISSVALI